MPKFLHSEEPVRNRHIGKRDCMLLIQEIWREKALKDAKVAQHSSDHSFGSVFLMVKVTSVYQRIEKFEL